MTKGKRGRSFLRLSFNTGASAIRSECTRVTWSVRDYPDPASNKWSRGSSKNWRPRKSRRCIAATRAFRNRKRLLREFTGARMRRQQKHRQNQSGRKQTVFAKCLQDERLNSHQQRRNDQRGAGQIEKGPGHPVQRMFGIFEDFEDGEAEYHHIKGQSN